MGWFLIGVLLGGAYGFLWALMFVGADDDDPAMPADRRWRDDR